MSGGVLGAVVACVIIGLFVVFFFFWTLSRRRIVPTNMVHVVQKTHSTKSYGYGSSHGNTYYDWPEWFPFIGNKTRVLSISNFDLSFQNYEAYDAARLPFTLDIQCFFRIEDTNAAAAKVESMEELYKHLRGIVQGAVRSLLAKGQLEEIMTERSKYGEEFTDSVKGQLEEWGVICVKNIELMDIRDSSGSNVIANIMQKKKSEIEKESRVVVANNMQEATTAELEAQKQIDVKKAETDRISGQAQAVADQAIRIAQEKANQQVQDEARITAEKDMEVIKVRTIRQADINKEQAIVEAEAMKKSRTIEAEGIKLAAEQKAEAVKKEKEAEAKGIFDVGQAQAEAEKARQLATVTAQIKLQNSLSADESYKNYLIAVKQIEMDAEVKKAQAKALEAGLDKANLKVIVNSADAESGINKITDILSPKGGASLGSALEMLNNTDSGKMLVDKFFTKKNTDKKGDKK